MNNDSPKTAKSDLGAEGADDDVQSDPAKGAEDRADWLDEGGATSRRDHRHRRPDDPTR